MARNLHNRTFIGWALSNPVDERWRTVAHLIATMPSKHAPEIIEEMAACDRRRKYGAVREKLYEVGAQYVCEVCEGIAVTHKISRRLNPPAVRNKAA